MTLCLCLSSMKLRQILFLQGESEPVAGTEGGAHCVEPRGWCLNSDSCNPEKKFKKGGFRNTLTGEELVL